MLSLIDMQPRNKTCIYSTLLFVENQSRKLNFETPCLTFDQPLSYKVNKIIIEKNLSVKCRLVGFHTLINFLGSIGIFMDGSGIADVLVLVYSPNTVRTLLPGKAYSRVLAGHMLLDATLCSTLLDTLIYLMN